MGDASFDGMGTSSGAHQCGVTHVPGLKCYLCLRTVPVTELTRIVDFAAMSRLPAIYGLREFVDAGGLMAFGTDLRDLFRRSATYVHRILNGAKPADLPVEPPAKFELVINLKAAKALGLTIPPSLLLRADYVIQ